jgi:hypothetical protein
MYYLKLKKLQKNRTSSFHEFLNEFENYKLLKVRGSGCKLEVLGYP